MRITSQLLIGLVIFCLSQIGFASGTHNPWAPNVTVNSTHQKNTINNPQYNTQKTYNTTNNVDKSSDYIDRSVTNQFDNAGPVVTGNGSQAQEQSANNEGVTVNSNEVHPDDIRVRQLGTLVSQPNNNTSNCIKVWGIASGNKDIQGILGIPDRDEQCDLDNAAKDSFAQGNFLLGWHWKCNMRSLQKVSKGRTWGDRYNSCMDTVKKLYPTVVAPAALSKQEMIDAYKETIVPLTTDEKTEAFTESLTTK